jgi:hypothetical protein
VRGRIGPGKEKLGRVEEEGKKELGWAARGKNKGRKKAKLGWAARKKREGGSGSIRKRGETRIAFKCI